MSGWSTAEWTLTLPAEGSLGTYSVRAILETDRVKRDPAGPVQREQYEEENREWKQTVTGDFLVAAYRRPDFRVDVTLTGDSRIAGDPAARRRVGPLPVWCADGDAPDAVAVHTGAAVFRAVSDCGNVPRRTLDLRRVT